MIITGKIVLVETKGEDPDNSDSSKNIYGAKSIHELLDIIAGLK